MRRGDIYLVDLDPARPGEANKTRPAVVVSNNSMNTATSIRGRGSVVVVPLTSNVAKVWDFQTFLPATETGTDRDSKAQPGQVRSISAQRVGELVGAVPPRLMAEIDANLRDVLSL